MNFQKLILIAVIINLLFVCCSCKPIKNRRIKRLIKQIFYIPPSGQPYFNASVETRLETTKNVCSQGVCVPFHLCVNGNVVTTGANLFGPRLALEAGSDESRFCDEMERCCKLSYDDDDNNDNNLSEDDVIISEDQQTISEIEELPMTNQLGDMDDVTGYIDNDMLEYTDNWRPRCGIRNFNLLKPRIAGDDKAENMEFPWMVVVLKKSQKSKYYDYQCGGSLIHPSVVLTAAHCVAQVKPELLHIRAGEWDMESTDESIPHQDRDIKSVVVHRDYIKPTLVNDIAMLILKVPVELAENVNPICLPPPNYSFDNQLCIVTGWGKDDYVGKYQSTLKKVELPIIPTNVCEMLLRKTVLGKYFRLDNTFLCAGSEYGKDSCKGDGGSPLVCRISSTSYSYYQSGIVSWGIKCKESNVPGAYVNVARYRDWIDKVMHRMKLEINSYIYD